MTMLSKTYHYIFSCIAALVLIFNWGGLRADEQPNSAAKDDAARGILQERLAVLSEIATLQRKAYEAGEVQLPAVLSAESDVVSAKLELAPTAAERIAILETMVENARELEEVAERLAEAREATTVDHLKAKAFRLRAQAELVRARSAPK
jgi:outer membrane protein TolC